MPPSMACPLTGLFQVFLSVSIPVCQGTDQGERRSAEKTSGGHLSGKESYEQCYYQMMPQIIFNKAQGFYQVVFYGIL